MNAMHDADRTEARAAYARTRTAALNLLASEGIYRTHAQFNTACDLRTPCTPWEWVATADRIFKSVVALLTDELSVPARNHRLNLIFEP